MKSRKFASHYFLKPDGSLGRWAVVEFSHKGEVISASYNPGGLMEQPSLEFHGGILIPGLIDFSNATSLDERTLNRHFAAGTFAICCPENLSSEKRKSPPFFHNSSNEVFSENHSFINNENTPPIFERIKTELSSNNRLSLIDLLYQATAKNAKKAGLSKKIGSFTEGLYPGLLVLENIDLNTFELTSKTRLRWLISYGV